MSGHISVGDLVEVLGESWACKDYLKGMIGIVTQVDRQRAHLSGATIIIGNEKHFVYQDDLKILSKAGR